MSKPDSVANKATDYQQILHVNDQNNKLQRTSESRNKINIRKSKRVNITGLTPPEMYKLIKLRLEQTFNHSNYTRYFKIQANKEENLANIIVIKVII